MDFLSSYKRRIDNYLSDYLIAQSKIHSTFPWGNDIITKLLPFITSGKTIRGSLVLFACQGYGNKITDDALRIASALELIHSGLLIHDDIMDNDKLRRNKDSIFIQYEKQSEQHKPSNRTDYGKNMAICFGDATFFIAMELINGCKDTDFSNKLLSYLLPEYSDVCFAQMQDIDFASLISIPKESDILSMYRYKTARYTFSLPLYAGALYANADQKEVQKLIFLGELIGIVFQLTDDLLNIFGTTETIGKSILSDITSGKKTILLSALANKTTAKEASIINSILQQPSVTLDNQQFILNLYEKYHMRQYIQNFITDYASLAKQHMMKLSLSMIYKQHMIDILAYLVKRTY